MPCLLSSQIGRKLSIKAGISQAARTEPDVCAEATREAIFLDSHRVPGHLDGWGGIEQHSLIMH